MVHGRNESYVPLLHFLAGLIGTSVALVAAAMAAMKDVWAVDDWKLPLLSFVGWMAVTIVFATLASSFIQLRRSFLIPRVTADVAKKPRSRHLYCPSSLASSPRCS
jgi:hypothetical protein